MTSLSLHTLELMGGFAGSLLARPFGGHKTNLRKEFGFNMATGLISILHIAGWLLL